MSRACFHVGALPVHAARMQGSHTFREEADLWLQRAAPSDRRDVSDTDQLVDAARGMWGRELLLSASGPHGLYAQLVMFAKFGSPIIPDDVIGRGCVETLGLLWVLGRGSGLPANDADLSSLPV